MLIKEVLVEAYKDELISAVQDILALAMSRDIEKISTQKFIKALAKQGYVASTEEVIQAVDQSGFASSVNDTEIVPANQLSGDVDTDVDDGADVSAMAGNQAMKDIKAEL